MDLLVASMQTGRGAAPSQTTHSIALGRVLSGKGWTRALQGHKNVSLQQADPQWYMVRDAKPASCGTTLRAPAPAGIFFWILVLSPL